MRDAALVPPVCALLTWRLAERAADTVADFADVGRGLAAYALAMFAAGCASAYIGMFLKPHEMQALNQLFGVLIAPVVIPLVAGLLFGAWRLTRADDLFSGRSAPPRPR